MNYHEQSGNVQPVIRQATPVYLKSASEWLDKRGSAVAERSEDSCANRSPVNLTNG